MRTYTNTSDILDLICSASNLGNLGLFVGAGFTKAVLEDNFEFKAYSWYELLERCCDKMGVDKKILKQKGSYSEIASNLCKQYAINEGKDYQNGVIYLKNVIAELTNIYPTESSIEDYQNHFKNLKVNWVVTTNYDTLLENIFIGRCLPLGPHESFIKINELIPIYHIHGVRTEPNNIVITNEDYVSLFRPNDYRQSRLPFLIKESIVLMIGYGLGDINVITALDWSKNVYNNVSEIYDTEIIQLLYTETPKDKPYRDTSGVLIVEINDLSIFFKELNEHYLDYSIDYNDNLCKMNAYISMFISPSDNEISEFIDNENERKAIIQYISNLNMQFSYIYPHYISFLQKVLSHLNKRAKPRGAFDAYDQKLQVLIDIFEHMDIKKIPPSFFSLLAESFDYVAYYVGNNKGESWKAKETWDREKGRIPKAIIKELKKFTEAKKGCWQLRKLLED